MWCRSLRLPVSSQFRWWAQGMAVGPERSHWKGFSPQMCSAILQIGHSNAQLARSNLPMLIWKQPSTNISGWQTTVHSTRPIWVLVSRTRIAPLGMARRPCTLWEAGSCNMTRSRMPSSSRAFSFSRARMANKLFRSRLEVEFISLQRANIYRKPLRSHKRLLSHQSL